MAGVEEFVGVPGDVSAWIAGGGLGRGGIRPSAGSFGPGAINGFRGRSGSRLLR